MLYRILYIIVWPIFRLLFPLKTYFRKKNYKKGKGLVICNHFSNLDIIMAAMCNFEMYGVMGKKELFEKKFNNWFLRKLGAFPIDREGNDVKAIMTSIKVLKSGKKMVIFPEGTRNKINDDLQEVKGGVGLLAIKAKVPIYPMMNLTRHKLFRKNHVIFGEPFELTQYYDRKLTSQDFDDIAEIFRSKMIALHEELRNMVYFKKKK